MGNWYLHEMKAGVLRGACLVALLTASAAGQWSDPVNISHTSGRYSVNPSWEFDANGKIHMVFLDWIDWSKRVYYVHNVNGYWSRTQLASWSKARNPGAAVGLVITPDQVIHIFYYRDGIKYVHKPVRGGSWSSPVRIDNAQAAGCSAPDPSHPSEWPSCNYFGSVGTDGAGGIFVTWLSLSNEDMSPVNAYWGRYKPLGGDFECLELVCGSDDGDKWPVANQVISDGTDLFVTYQLNGSYYRKRTPAGSWSSPVLVDASGKNGRGRMAFSPTGEWAFVYHKDTGGGASDPWFEVFVRTSNNQGATWSGETNISNHIGLDRGPRLCYDADGDLHVLFHLFPNGYDDGKPEIYYRPRINGNWQSRVNLTNRPNSREGLPADEGIRARNGILYMVYMATDDDGYEEVYIRQTAPQIDLNRSTIERTTWIGTNLSDSSFTIRNSGPDTVNYSITDNASWLSVSPNSGSTSGETDTITVQYDVGSFLAGTYQAQITVTSPEAWNSPQTINVVVEIEAVGPDFDGDGDVDLDDFGHLQTCYTGTGIEQTDPACLDARLDYDGTNYGDKDVDMADYAILANCFSGPDVFAAPDCED